MKTNNLYQMVTPKEETVDIKGYVARLIADVKSTTPVVIGGINRITLNYDELLEALEVFKTLADEATKMNICLQTISAIARGDVNFKMEEPDENS